MKIGTFFVRNHPENPGKSPENSPENPRKKSAFFSGFFPVHAMLRARTAKNAEGKFPEIRGISGRKFSGIFPGDKKFPEISGKKVSKMTIFGKFNTLLRSELFWSHF